MIDPKIKQDLEFYLQRNYSKEKDSTAVPHPASIMSLMKQKRPSPTNR